MNWLSHCWIQYIVLHDWIIFTHFSKRFLNNWNSQCILILSSDTNVQRLFFKFLCHDTCRVFTGSWSTKISHPHLAVVDRLLKFWLMPGSEARVLTLDHRLGGYGGRAGYLACHSAGSTPQQYHTTAFCWDTTLMTINNSHFSQRQYLYANPKPTLTHLCSSQQLF